MPYFVYKITERPVRQLEKLAEYDAYRDASASVKKMRSDLPEDANYRLKVIFGETELHAEDALNQVREPDLSPDD